MQRHRGSMVGNTACKACSGVDEAARAGRQQIRNERLGRHLLHNICCPGLRSNVVPKAAAHATRPKSLHRTPSCPAGGGQLKQTYKGPRAAGVANPIATMTMLQAARAGRRGLASLSKALVSVSLGACPLATSWPCPLRFPFLQSLQASRSRGFAAQVGCLGDRLAPCRLYVQAPG